MEYPIHLLALLCISFLLHAKEIQIDSITYKIYQNECGANLQKLIHWNTGENFPSLGIGHFIWYPKGIKEPFDESFPKLLTFMQKKHVLLPPWLTPNTHAPWYSKTQMQQDSKKTKQLRLFLQHTMDIQAEFMAHRVKHALPKLIDKLSQSQQKKVITNYERIASTPNGNYILIDYINFKGEGTKQSERYKGEGWGLLQVLLCMKIYENPNQAFVTCAKKLLQQRVYNAPKERGEQIWLKGWFNRLDSYLLF